MSICNLCGGTVGHALDCKYHVATPWLTEEQLVNKRIAQAEKVLEWVRTQPAPIRDAWLAYLEEES